MIRAAGAGERGFTLIEILIAVIVLAIGLLGVAGLQTVSMQQTAASDSRSVAIMHAQTMAERIRSIRGVPAGGEINAWLDEVRADLGADADGDVEAQGTNGAVISLQWVERMNRLDPSSAGQDGEVVRDPVVSNFTLNVRYRE
jgi:type IV pilus assembly protein PilV